MGKVRVGTGTPAAAHPVLLLGTVGVGGEQRHHHRLRRIHRSGMVQREVPILRSAATRRVSDDTGVRVCGRPMRAS